MRTNRAALAILAATSITVMFPFPVRAQATGAMVTIIEMCDFQVPRAVEQANATFGMAFKMQIGEGGEPVNIETVEKHFLDESVFVNCIKRWRLPAKPGETVRVEFQWVHGKGWINLSVMGTTFAQHIRIAPGTCVPVGK